ncbi:MAG: cysteine desulfurase-like protein [Planctomycetota bacterium]|nr:MAG: cysteine desulfurase-like protein [Planctomycetota bacterium]
MTDHPPRTAAAFDVDWCRKQFPALSKTLDGLPAVFFDGPAGSQVPHRVVDAVCRYLIETNANHGGLFDTSQASDSLLESAHEAVADFLGTSDPDTVVFGPNMTSLTFSLSRALARTWRPGDEILLTQAEHDADFTPWKLAAEDAGATVRVVSIRPEDASIDLDDFRRKLSEKTRLVAVGCASNALGTVQPFETIIAEAHAAGALVFLDAVHYAPHRLIDVTAWDCDFLTCSAYKFFGPHVGVLWGRRELLETIEPYKVRPAPDDLPGRWMTGTQNHEGIAGVKAAVDYLAELGHRIDPEADHRRHQLATAFQAITAYETELVYGLIDDLSGLQHVRVLGITDRARAGDRVPTIGLLHDRLSPRDLAEYLGRRGVFTWHGNFYALPLTEALGLEPDGMLRVGLLHYNTVEETKRLVALLREIDE